MATFLFDKIIFGPVKSRRLGESLGINLLPTNKKICNFDCVYCECGLTDSMSSKMPSRKEVKEGLYKFLYEYSNAGKRIDAITFAGNGEPTLHNEFSEIIDDTFELRNQFYPKATIALLTNSTTILNKRIRKSFHKIDQNMLKLDSVIQETVRILNCPLGNFKIQTIINAIKEIKEPIIQTMFVRGSYNGIAVDNTTDYEVGSWLDVIKDINPSLVMIYTIARDTPFNTLKKVPLDELESIGERVKNIGIEVHISG